MPGPVTITGMVGCLEADQHTGLHGYLLLGDGADVVRRLPGVQVFGGGLLPVAVAAQVGYGMTEDPGRVGHPGYSVTSIPVGVGISLDPPLFPLKPWIAPRYQITNYGSGGPSNTSNFAVSGGVNFNLLLGLGVHAAVDWQQQKIGGTTYTPLIWSVGAHFNFHVPM